MRTSGDPPLHRIGFSSLPIAFRDLTPLGTLLSIAASTVPVQASLDWWLPSSVAAGQEYFVGAESWDNDVTITICKNGGYFCSGSGSPYEDEDSNPVPFSVGSWTSDNSGPVGYSASTSYGDSLEGSVEIYGPPVITMQPQPQTANQGATAQFNVSAEGTAPVSYQWRKNGTSIPGRTTAALTLTNAQTGDAGNYSVVVSNFYGSVTSNTVALTVIMPSVPAIIAQPVNQTVNTAAVAAARISVTGGYYHSLFVRNDGTVWACGDNGHGQLGDGTMAMRLSPVQVSGLGGIVAVSAGAFHSMALKTDGTVWTWGFNSAGQLGAGTSGADSLLPLQVNGLGDVFAIAAGQSHCLALKRDGTAWAWGDNSLGQLGDGTTSSRASPVQVPGLAGVLSVVAGYGHSAAVKSDRTAWAWGYNGNGQLGDGTLTQRNAPVPIATLSGVWQLGAGSFSSHTVALKDDGTVWAWGGNWYGQLGDGTTTMRPTPATVSGMTLAAAVSAGCIQNLVRRSDGTLWAWGNNNYGQLGDGTQIQRTTPVLSILTEPAAIAAAVLHSTAIKTDGSVWSWGCNGYGQLGDGTTLTRSTPVQVGGFTGMLPAVVSSAAFTVTNTGFPAPTYQWQRKPAGQSAFVNLASIAPYTGVNAPVLFLQGLGWNMSGDQYRCVITNALGSVTSNAATLTIASVGSSATHTANVTSYTPGGIVTFNCTLMFAGTAGGLGWEVSLPPGWAYVGGSGNEGGVKPQVGTTAMLEWAWMSPPASPVTFSYTVSVPVGTTGSAPITGVGTLWQSGFRTTLTTTPIVLGQTP